MEDNLLKISKSLKSLLLNIPKSFKFETYKYSVIKIIPYKTGYKDEDFEKIMNTLNKYNNGFFERFELDKENRVLKYHPVQALCFEILFTKDKIIYNYAIPSIYKTVFINKLKYLLHDCDIVEVNEYISDFNKSIKVNYHNKDSWFLSLNLNKNININDSLMIINSDLQDTNDEVLIQYLFKPLFDYEWKNKWDDIYKIYNRTGVLQNSNGLLEKLDFINGKFLEQMDLIINAIMEAFGGNTPLEFDNTKENFAKDLSLDTKHKTLYDGFKTGMNVYIKTQNQIVIDNISRNINTVLQDLQDDNSIVIKKSSIIEKADRIFKNGMILNTIECRQLIKLLVLT